MTVWKPGLGRGCGRGISVHSPVGPTSQDLANTESASWGRFFVSQWGAGAVLAVGRGAGTGFVRVTADSYSGLLARARKASRRHSGGTAARPPQPDDRAGARHSMLDNAAAYCQRGGRGAS